MSVLIRGMEMPTEGEWISVNIFPDGKCVVQSWCGKDFICAEKLTAVPVPEHGELIEREPILDVMRKERDRISETYGPNDEYVNCLNKYAISIVTSAKTIIPAEEET
jgi:hypothetical protein